MSENVTQSSFNTTSGFDSTPKLPAPTANSEENFIMRALTWNMLFTCSVFLALFIGFLWCICHFIVKYCHQRAVDNYQRHEAEAQQYIRELGIDRLSERQIMREIAREPEADLMLNSNGVVQRRDGYEAQKSKLQVTQFNGAAMTA